MGIFIIVISDVFRIDLRSLYAREKTGKIKSCVALIDNS